MEIEMFLRCTYFAFCKLFRHQLCFWRSFTYTAVCEVYLTSVCSNKQTIATWFWWKETRYCLCRELFSPPFPFSQGIVFCFPENKKINFLPLKKGGLFERGWAWFTVIGPLDSKTSTTTSTRFDLKLFREFSKYRLPGELHFTIFHYKHKHSHL